MDGNTTDVGGEPVAAFLTDEQYSMLFGEARPTTVHRARPSETRRDTSEPSGTRWDRRAAVSRTVDPPSVPTLDLTTPDHRIELDIFANDRDMRSLDVAKSARVRAIVAAEEFAAADAASRARTRRDVRSRALSLAFAFAGLTATIALWMIAIATYY